MCALDRKLKGKGCNMTIKDTIKKGMIDLKVNGISEPNLKARLIMQFILNKPRQYILVYDNQILTLRQEVDYFKAIKKLIKGIPLQHITNMQEFMKMNFYVYVNVLIPRQDTEVLVEEVIKIAQKTNAKNILDMCTGSGAIAVSLAKNIENSHITAVDISAKALNIAKKNARNNLVENQITFVSSNLFENLAGQKYDIIVSNPPYIRKSLIKSLDDEVQKEPIIALDGGEDGLDFYRKIVKHGHEFLKYNGYLCLEIGYDQKIDVIELIENENNYVDTYCKKDLFENDRVIVTHVL